MIAPTWTLNYGLNIPVKDGRPGFQELGPNASKRCQTRWKSVKLLIIDEKSMIGQYVFGKVDRRLRQVFPNSQDETLGNLPAIIFGDFGQLPPVGDTPLYSTSH